MEAHEIRTEYMPTKFEFKKNYVGKYVITESWDHWVSGPLGTGYTRLSTILPGSYHFKWSARRAVRYYQRTGGGC